MYVVTYHDFGGSAAEAAQPEEAWLFSTTAEASAFKANFLKRCKAINPVFAQESEFALITTPITNALATTSAPTHDELFNSWIEEVQPYWLDLDEDELKEAKAAGKAIDDRKAREAAVQDGWKTKCPACQGRGYGHSHMPAWACSEAELLEQERKLGIIS